MTINHRGYTATQADNHHIMIFDQDGNIVAHINCTQPQTEEELKDSIDEVLKLKEEFNR